MLRAVVGALDGLSAGGTAVLAVAAAPADAARARAAGAALVDLGGAGRAAIASVRAALPGLLVCAADEQADIVRDPALALRSGAILACPDPAAASRAGLPASQLLVEVSPDRLVAAREAGYATLVDLADEPGVDAASLAIAAICAWLGATVVRTWHPRQTCRAVDMTASIRGIRPPARTVRGLG